VEVVQKLLRDEAYRELQNTLVKRPDMGAIIVGSGGIRKVRRAGASRGKSGGFRVIYYWAAAEDRILMLMIYPKSEKDDLTRDQIRILRKIIKEEYP
jgi:mRNA-degrading endonuclease RelE of RelBE toxin-antitoxin system